MNLACFEHITDPNSSAFHNWNSHIDSVVFSDKLDWSMRIMEGMRKAMLREYGDIHVCRSGSRNNRSFMFKCKTCQEAACVQYRPSCTSADVQTKILQLFDFLRLERPNGNYVDRMIGHNPDETHRRNRTVRVPLSMIREVTRHWSAIRGVLVKNLSQCTSRMHD